MYGAVIRPFSLYIPKTDRSEMSFPLSLYDSLSPNPEKTVAMQMRMITFLSAKSSIHYEYYEDRKTRRDVFRCKIMKVICYLLFMKCS